MKVDSRPSTKHGDLDYAKVAVAFREHVEVKDRRFRLQKYKQCFIASDGVNFLVMSGLAPTREAAVEMCRYMQNKMGLFDHVTKDHQYSDDYLFFRFNDSKFGGADFSESISSTGLKPDPPQAEKRRSGLYGIKTGPRSSEGAQFGKFMKRNSYLSKDMESGARKDAVLAEAEKTMRQAEICDQIKECVNRGCVNGPFESKIPAEDMRCLALVAHNHMKPAMKQFIESHSEILKKFRLTGTNTTMTMCKNVFGEDNDEVMYGPTCTSGPLGGDAQLSALMCLEDLGGMIFFMDPLSPHPHQADIDSLVRLANVHNVLFCPNPATAMAMMWMMRDALENNKPQLFPSMFQTLESPSVPEYKAGQKRELEKNLN